MQVAADNGFLENWNFRWELKDLCGPYRLGFFCTMSSLMFVSADGKVSFGVFMFVSSWRSWQVSR